MPDAGSQTIEVKIVPTVDAAAFANVKSALAGMGVSGSKGSVNRIKNSSFDIAKVQADWLKMQNKQALKSMQAFGESDKTILQTHVGNISEAMEKNALYFEKLNDVLNKTFYPIRTEAPRVSEGMATVADGLFSFGKMSGKGSVSGGKGGPKSISLVLGREARVVQGIVSQGIAVGLGVAGVIGIWLSIGEILKTAFSAVFKMLGAIFKVLGMTLMPIANLLLGPLLALVYILMPLMKFMWMMWRPHQQKIMQDVKAAKARGAGSGEMLNVALVSTATQAAMFFGQLFSVALGELAKGIVDGFITAIQIVVLLLGGLGNLLARLFDILTGGIFDAEGNWGNFVAYIVGGLEEAKGAFNAMVDAGVKIAIAALSGDAGLEGAAQKAAMALSGGAGTVQALADVLVQAGFYPQGFGQKIADSLKKGQDAAEIFKKSVFAVADEMIKKSNELNSSIKATQSAAANISTTTTTHTTTQGDWLNGLMNMVGVMLPHGASGGYVAGTGMAVIHQGETITPAGSGFGGGNLNITLELDGDVVAKKVISSQTFRNETLRRSFGG